MSHHPQQRHEHDPIHRLPPPHPYRYAPVGFSAWAPPPLYYGMPVGGVPVPVPVRYGDASSSPSKMDGKTIAAISAGVVGVVALVAIGAVVVMSKKKGAA